MDLEKLNNDENGCFEEPLLDLNVQQNEDENNAQDRTMMNSARLKFEEICENIDKEEFKIVELETRRKRLVNDMERLQKEIEYEKLLFREAIDIEIGKKHQPESNDETKSVKSTPSIDPFSIDRDEVRCRLKDYRESLQQSIEKTNLRQDDSEIQQFKLNLLQYKKGLENSETNKILREKRKSAVKVFQKHLKNIETQCSHHIDKIDNIQKNIEHFNDYQPGDAEK